MKLITRILPLCILLLPAVSCHKEQNGEPGHPGEVKVSFQASSPTAAYGLPGESAEGDPTKITDHPDGTSHTIHWSEGDKISMFAYKTPTSAGLMSSSNAVNFSSNRFTADADGVSANFTGWVPELDGTLPQGYQPLYAVYPACNLSLSSQSYQYSNGTCYYKITGPSISERQDGTGWRYCWFTARNGTIAATARNIGTAPTFTLANALIRLRYVSGKEIKKIEITQQEKTLPGLAGPFTLYTMWNAIAEGCGSYTIVLEKGGEALPADLLLACRDIRAGRTVTFTFTATDGSTVSRSLKASASYSPGKIYNLSPIDLSEWTSSELAADAARNMGMGVSVGGLDHYTPQAESIAERADANGMHRLDRNDPATYETNGNKDRITQTTMNALYAAGFHTVRIPITWWPHMDSPSGPIDQVWLDHIQSVVDLARNAGMYVILNIHHDTGTADTAWLKADWANYGTISASFKNIWTQIATQFKDYDYHLLFEGYNEIVDETKRWFIPRSANGYKAANALNQDFVDVVRTSGGANSVRNLIVSTYTSSDWPDAMQGFVMPNDLTDGHLMVQIHSYRPAAFVTAREVGDNSRLEFYEEDKAEIDATFEDIQTGILDKGWPCVLGEYGAFFKKDADGNRNEEGRAEHAYYYTMKALQKGIVPIYWYNPMDYRDRDEGRWTFPILAEGLKKAWSDFQQNQGQ